MKNIVSHRNIIWSLDFKIWHIMGIVSQMSHFVGQVVRRLKSGVQKQRFMIEFYLFLLDQTLLGQSYVLHPKFSFFARLGYEPTSSSLLVKLGTSADFGLLPGRRWQSCSPRPLSDVSRLRGQVVFKPTGNRPKNPSFRSNLSHTRTTAHFLNIV